MSNIQIIQIEQLTGIEDFVIIENENGFTSMPKSVYDEQQAALKDK